MTNEKQLTLFSQLPSQRDRKLTLAQRRVLDQLVLLDGAPPAGRKLQTSVLRSLINARLINVVGLGPARYRVTQVGRLLRSRASFHE